MANNYIDSDSARQGKLEELVANVEGCYEYKFAAPQSHAFSNGDTARGGVMALELFPHVFGVKCVCTYYQLWTEQDEEILVKSEPEIYTVEGGLTSSEIEGAYFRIVNFLDNPKERAFYNMQYHFNEDYTVKTAYFDYFPDKKKIWDCTAVDLRPIEPDLKLKYAPEGVKFPAGNSADLKPQAFNLD